jgi:serine/threonine-protein kinase
MNDADQHLRGLSTEQRRRLDSIVWRFEEAWEKGQQPAIEDYTPGDSVATLVELIFVDLERRLRAGQTPRVETYLDRYPTLSSRPDVLVELIAAEYQLRRQREAGISPEEYLGRFPQLGTEIEKRLAGSTPPADGSSASGAGAPTELLSPAEMRASAASPAPDRAGGTRYRSLRFHARGGLGEVLVAHDDELHREVALKRIQERYVHDRASRRRFLREAEITAGLEHPGVVPVHGLIHDADGSPCYAMRFIQGDTLQQAIQRFHEAEKPGRDVRERGLILRQLLGRFIAVCNTVAYAHSRGIVHRDLKPSNIMLGDYGETLVVDWGLANFIPPEALETPSGDGSESRGASPVSRHQSGSEAGPPTGGETAPARPTPLPGGTATGEAMGTPAYMSPEQAAGRWDMVGPAADIYSLGATLYTLLTGQPPVTGASQEEVLARVRRGDWPAPRQVKKDTPRALDAICRKAMALRPLDRYPTALALAEDVEHWLADEAVTAQREPVSARLARWARRHRAWVLAGTVLLLAAVAGLTTGTILLGAANARTEEQRALAERQSTIARGQSAEAQRQTRIARRESREANKQRERAERKSTEAREQRDLAMVHFQTAQHAVDDYLTRISQSRLLRQPRLEPLRKELLQTALTYYRGFVARHQDDLSARAGLGLAYDRLALVTSQIGTRREAIRLEKQAVAILESLAPRWTEEDNHWIDLAGGYDRLADLHSDTGQGNRAEAARHKARTFWQKTAVANPKTADSAGLLAQTLRDLSSLGDLHDAGQKLKAEEVFRQATAVAGKLAVDHPVGRRLQKHMQLTYQLLIGGRAHASGASAQAEAAFKRARTLAEQLAADEPSNPSTQQELADIDYDLGYLFSTTGRYKLAEEAFRRSLDILDRLAADHPDVIKYQRRRGQSLNDLGLVYQESGRTAQAEATYEKVRRLWEDLVRRDPDVLDFQHHLARARGNLAFLFYLAGQTARCEPLFLGARDAWEKLVQADPRNDLYQTDLAKTYNHLGNLYRTTDRTELAEPAYRKAIELHDRLARADQANIRHAVSLGSVYGNMGLIRSQAGKHQAALDWLDRSVAMLEMVLRKEPRHRKAQEYLSHNLEWRAEALSRLGRYRDALKDLDRVIKSEGIWVVASDARLARALIQARLGRHARAAAEAGPFDLPLLDYHPTGEVFFRLASVYSLCATAARQDGQVTPDKQTALADRYIAKALTHLAKADKAGYFESMDRVDQLRKDPLFAPVRMRDEYRQLAARLPKGPKAWHAEAARRFRRGQELSAKKDKGAEAELRAAVTVDKELTQAFPQSADFRRSLLAWQDGLAAWLQAAGRSQEAEQVVLRALSTARKLADDFAKVPDYRRDLVQRHLAHGRLLHRAGRFAEADQALAQGLTRARRLTADFPVEPRYRLTLAGGLDDRADLLKELGRWPEAEKAGREAIALCKQLLREHPKDPPTREELARGQQMLGELLFHTEDLRGGLPLLGEALRGQKALATEFPSQVRYRRPLAHIYTNMADIMLMSGLHVQGEQTYRLALEMIGTLAKKFPQEPAHRQDQATAETNLASLLQARGRLVDAEEHCRRGLEARRKLTQEYPNEREYRRDLANSHDTLGHILQAAGKPEEAIQAYREGVAVLRKLTEDFPAVPDCQSRLGGMLHNLATRLTQRGELAEARQLLDEAVRYQQTALKANPIQRDFRQFLRNHSSAFLTLGRRLQELQRYDEAEEVIRRALDIRRQPANDYPTLSEHRIDLAAAYTDLGSLYYEARRFAEAEEAHRRGLELEEQLFRESPRAAARHSALGGAQNNLARVLAQTGHLGSARWLLEQAIPHQQTALRAEPGNPTYRQFLRNHYTLLAKVLLQQKEHAELARTAALLVKASPDGWEERYRAARYLARCVILGKADAKLSRRRRQELTERYAAQAVSFLREARARGFGNLEGVAMESAFRPLHGRADYRALLKELKRKGDL